MSRRQRTLSATFVTRDFRGLTEALVERLSHQGPPSELEVKNRPAPLTPGWLEATFEAAQVPFTVRWTDGSQVPGSFTFQVCWRDGSWIKFLRTRVFTHTAVPLEAATVLEWLAGVPFEVASFPPIHVPDPDQGFVPPVFRLERNHMPDGWACAFRGSGHDRLVSRRWLEHGAWKLWRGEHDTSLVQFHDLAADTTTARAQATPGWERMGHQDPGITDTGGYISERHPIAHEIAGLYTRAEKRLECWTIRDGDRVRLDADFAPEPSPPAWTRALG